MTHTFIILNKHIKTVYNNNIYTYNNIVNTYKYKKLTKLD